MKIVKAYRVIPVTPTNVEQVRVAIKHSIRPSASMCLVFHAELGCCVLSADHDGLHEFWSKK